MSLSCHKESDFPRHDGIRHRHRIVYQVVSRRQARLSMCMYLVLRLGAPTRRCLCLFQRPPGPTAVSEEMSPSMPFLSFCRFSEDTPPLSVVASPDMTEKMRRQELSHILAKWTSCFILVYLRNLNHKHTKCALAKRERALLLEFSFS